ncbi:hypothetical protein I3842_01G180900 [Carya illinoinensis]|uniref:Uncharacterized protein n=1 Tax=Carya illinoinensis TaxID=32201 RepID=A0A922K4F6_CARIL|nr:hypothetical protein I3842_01G180900 [Carya illinoinensis]
MNFFFFCHDKDLIAKDPSSLSPFFVFPHALSFLPQPSPHAQPRENHHGPLPIDGGEFAGSIGSAPPRNLTDWCLLNPCSCPRLQNPLFSQKSVGASPLSLN